MANLANQKHLLLCMIPIWNTLFDNLFTVKPKPNKKLSFILEYTNPYHCVIINLKSMRDHSSMVVKDLHDHLEF